MQSTTNSLIYHSLPAGLEVTDLLDGHLWLHETQQSRVGETDRVKAVWWPPGDNDHTRAKDTEEDSRRERESEIKRCRKWCGRRWERIGRSDIWQCSVQQTRLSAGLYVVVLWHCRETGSRGLSFVIIHTLYRKKRVLHGTPLTLTTAS